LVQRQLSAIHLDRIILPMYIGRVHEVMGWEPSTSKKLGVNSKHCSTGLRQVKQLPLRDTAPSWQNWFPLPDAPNGCRRLPLSAERSSQKADH
jgi:hypothetical protein